MSDQDDLNRVRVQLGDWLATFNAKDLDGLMAFYDPDIVYASASVPLIRGINGVRDFYREMLAQVEGKLVFQEEAGFCGRDMALLTGAFCFLPDSDVGEAGPAGRVALLFRLSADGEWKLLFDTNNAPPDVSSEMFVRK